MTSELAAILPCVDRQVTEKALTDWLAGEGFTVVDFHDTRQWGYTNRRLRLVGVNARLLGRQRVPTLLHEVIHVQRHDDGHQSPVVEARIDEQVAILLVDRVEYQLAEERFGWHTGGIAAALDLPRWVIQAYRRTLKDGAGPSMLTRDVDSA